MDCGLKLSINPYAKFILLTSFMLKLGLFCFFFFQLGDERPHKMWGGVLPKTGAERYCYRITGVEKGVVSGVDLGLQWWEWEMFRSRQTSVISDVKENKQSVRAVLVDFIKVWIRIRVLWRVTLKKERRETAIIVLTLC